MTDSIVVTASFSDHKVYKTRGVLSLHFEVPIEMGNWALQRLGGIPLPGQERHVAIALLPDQEDEDQITPLFIP